MTMTEQELDQLFNPPEAFGGVREPFVPYKTMFKLDHSKVRTIAKETLIFCVNCRSSFPLQDLLNSELEEDQCPECKVWAPQYWADKPCRSV
jgi:hypothetical protein